MQRRAFLQTFGQLTSGLLLAGAGTDVLAAQKPSVQGARTLRLYNIHTGEQERCTYWENGHYIDSELHRLDLLLRDHRNGDVNAIQRSLYDRIYALQANLNPGKPVYIISGYRSPESNNALRNSSNGVAKRSLHMEGRAVDIRIPGVSHKDLHKAALALREGGVGYYPSSGFIHLDTGRTRRWTA